MRFSILILTGFLTTFTQAAPDGLEIYKQQCAMCHGADGMGMPGIYPPLAASDYLVKNREKSLRAPMEGLVGEIVVNGTHYNGGMPPVLLNDEELTAVFGYIFSSWDNKGEGPDLEEIKATRAKTPFPTLEALKGSMSMDTLPAAPEGWTLSVAVDLSFAPGRLLNHPDGENVIALSTLGDVWMWKPGEKEAKQLIKWQSYLDASLGDQLITGMAFDDKGRLYIASNQCNKNKKPVQNEVTIFRSGPWTKDAPSLELKPWYRTSYPFGIGPYNHGVSSLGQGPDGMMYANSGARTDGGEPGNKPNYSTLGEEPNTACMWRLNPEDDKPVVEIFARGLRNSYGFCWDDKGRMIATENGPDADAPEELNLIEEGKHYGFPYRFANTDQAWYPHTPKAPEGLKFTDPFVNVGAGAGKDGMATFDPHSCPTGIIWLDENWPAPLSGTFLSTRFGNMIRGEKDVGFDVIKMKVSFEDHTVKTDVQLAPIGRPIDLIKLPGHQVLIAEHTRATTQAAGLGTPGRLLILSPKK